MAQTDSSAWEAIRAADLAEKGTWPCAGGWLDQTAAIVEAVRFVWGEEAEWKAESRE